jgi:EAL domain-containing protein (putative c-di-GMP-specific phosphodiesterase class I)
MDRDEDDAVIVRSTIALGRNLGLRVVAEGVESAPVMDELRGLGCDEVQGYFVSRPVPAPALEDWLRDRDVSRTTV